MLLPREKVSPKALLGKFPMAKVLVVGGAGYIGSQTAKSLNLAGHEVAILDNLSTGFRHLAKYGKFFEGDILDRARLGEVLRDVKPDYVQLHQMEDSARVSAIQSVLSVPIITAISVRGPSDLSNIATLEEISAHLLFDAPAPGSGKAFDWHLLKNLPLKKKWFLAGGLTPENVAEAMRITGAPMVDVSSGIESAAGEKSLEKIAAFNAAVLHAAHG